MHNTKSIPTSSKTAATGTTEFTSLLSKSSTVAPRIDPRRLQNVILVWLDNSIDKNCADCQHTISQLRQVITNINTFTDADQCTQFIQNITENKIYLIVSGTIGQLIVPCVHAMSQVDSIFVFCSNRKLHEQWAGEWPKVKGVYTGIPPICDALKQLVQEREYNSIPLSFLAVNSADLIEKNFDNLDPTFVYSHVLKEISLAVEFNEKSIKDFLNRCYEALYDNERELRFIEKLRRHYRDQCPIWWYTNRCFLYPMLNQTLRVMDIEMIMPISFFIGDLHRDIQRLHLKQYTHDYSNKPFTIYRGHGITKSDFQQLNKTKNGLISFNNFLVTNKDILTSLRFAQQVARNPDLVGVLFIMTIDPAQSTLPFALISEVSHTHAENEILFSMHSIFRVHDIKPMTGNNHIYEIRVTLVSNNDKDLRALYDWIREETFPDEKGWNRLAMVFTKIGQYDKAEKLYEILLNQPMTEPQRATTFHELGRVKYSQGAYKDAIMYYQRALEIRQQTLPPNHIDFASFYNNIGLAYKSMDDYSSALLYYKKALDIQQQSLSGHHLNLGASYNNIGNLYDNMGDHIKALAAHEKALNIRLQELPANHPDVAFSYNSIGLLYDNMGDYPKALAAHEKALYIRQDSSSPNQTDLASSYNNIGNTYDNMGNYEKALASYEKSLEILQKTLPANHPDLAMSHYNIALVYQNMGSYSKARLFYEQAVEIGQNSLPPNHPHLELYQKNLDEIKRKL
ncbi:unnamed protein product [Adineta ricciae]|uniref:UDP-N-acetylglucosamine--peptide N-acetylglucosaminyltransferase SPINDLY n=1 Tax=Adineta ricciae TaxID=249248 RepID=A0A814DIJ6_ADIRI|nr:unnamed protein product [Adineta ricciae]CAF1482951.1 unnamed protein product [Adineta ricciae]